MVTTFAGSGQRTTRDGLGTAASIEDPIWMAYLQARNCLVLVQDVCVRRVQLPATPEFGLTLSRLIAAGLAGASPPLSLIAPLINLIVSYTVNDGTRFFLFLLSDYD